jgi:hypothetical protein
METAYVIIERQVAARKGVVDYNVGATLVARCETPFYTRSIL